MLRIRHQRITVRRVWRRVLGSDAAVEQDKSREWAFDPAVSLVGRRVGSVASSRANEVDEGECGQNGSWTEMGVWRRSVVFVDERE